MSVLAFDERCPSSNLNVRVLSCRAVDKIQKELKKSRDEHKKQLQEQHPVLSRIAPWLRAKLEAGEQSKLSKITWGAHEEALKIAQKLNLHQTIYFLNRDMAFMKEVRVVRFRLVLSNTNFNHTLAAGAGSPKGAEERQNTHAQLPVGLPNLVAQGVDNPAQLPGPLGGYTDRNYAAGHVHSYPTIRS